MAKVFHGQWIMTKVGSAVRVLALHGVVVPAYQLPLVTTVTNCYCELSRWLLLKEY